MESWIYGPLVLAADGRTLSGRFGCGGRLLASETAALVTLTFIAAAVGPGGLACAMVPIGVRLRGELGNRVVVDGVTHQRLSVRRS